MKIYEKLINSLILRKINLTEKLKRSGATKMLFILEEVKETILDFSK